MRHEAKRHGARIKVPQPQALAFVEQMRNVNSAAMTGRGML